MPLGVWRGQHGGVFFCDPAADRLMNKADNADHEPRHSRGNVDSGGPSGQFPAGTP
jgi:hypothetical protein